MPILVKYEDNYADEFDIAGFKIFETNDHYIKWSEEVEHAFYFDDCDLVRTGPVEIYFGTNEFVSFETIKDYQKCLEVKEISAYEADLLESLIGADYGIFIDPSYN